MKPTPAGRRHTRVIIEQPVETRSASGAVLTSWGTLAPVWAGIFPRTGRERFLAGKPAAEGETSIYVTYRADVTTKMRVNAGGVFYNIAAVIDRENRHRELELICTTGLNDG